MCNLRLIFSETSIIQHNESEIAIQPSPSAVKGSLKRKYPESGDCSEKMNASHLERDTCGNNLPVGSESDDVTEVERPVLLLTLPMEESTGVLPETIMSSETLTREDVSMEENKTTRDEQNEPAPQSLPMETTTSTSSSSPGRGHGEILPRSFPLVKTSGLSYLWKIIDSMSVFVSVPQQPHFCPLERYDENLREGLALGYMASFVNLVENMSAASLDEPRSSVEHRLLALDELEEHGFTVHPLRSRLLKVLEIKDTYKQLEDDLVEVERKITEETCDNGRLEEEMAELQESIMEKNKKLESVMVEKEMRGSIVSEFERRVDHFRQTIQTARDEFYCKRDSFPTFVPKLISNC